jgi:DNA-binding ferritin-like protein
MSTKTLSSVQGIATSVKEAGYFLGKVVSFNNSLKLYHWHVTGEGSYTQHIAIDQALADLLEVTDRLVETTYAQAGDVEIVVPATVTPTNIIDHVSGFYDFVEESRKLFTENFTQAIIDDYHEALQQLLYRLKRLK